MPKKKKVEEPVEAVELTEAADAAETVEAQTPDETVGAAEPQTPAGIAEPTEAQEPSTGADESMPPESAEDFALPEENGDAAPAREDAIPEPDMENAPDFWSDALEVSSADPAPAESLEPAAAEFGMPDGTTAGLDESAEVSAGGSEENPQTAIEGTEELPQPEGTTPYRPEEDAPQERAPTRPGLMAEGAERRAFFGLDFHELDRNLSQQERQEWSSIYASFRGHSVMTGKIAGVDPHDFRIRDRRTGEITTRTFYCAVVIPFRIPILIPETELWFRGEERPRNVTRNIGGSTIDFVITQVDRKTNFVLASRRLALASRRYFFSTQPQMNQPGSRLDCRVLTVGNRRLLATCHGYDITLTQRELDYTAIPDLKARFRRDEVLECIVKEYNSRQNHLEISVKETIPNPYDGAEFRHPLGCSRQALISGKYGGGVFCNLTDGVTVMCNYSFQYEDSDFLIGDSVTVVIQRYDSEKKQIFGKIVARE